MGMVLVNLQGSDPDSFSILVHSRWDGVTIADLVFPFFILASGLAVPLAMDGRKVALPWRSMVRRSLILFGIGLIIGWLLHPSLLASEFRVTGVLQRIAIVYGGCAALALLTRGVAAPALAGFGLLIAHLILLKVPLFEGVYVDLSPGGGSSGLLDRLVLPGRLLRGSYDPEGVLSTLSSIGMSMLGVSVQRLIAGRERPITPLAMTSLASVLLGVALALIVPFNKPLWTPSYALLTTGLGLGLWASLKAGWPLVGGSRVARLVALLGQNALTLYVVHMLLIAALLLPSGNGQNLWERSFGAIAETGPSLAWMSLLYAIIASAASIAATRALVRRGWALKL